MEECETLVHDNSGESEGGVAPRTSTENDLRSDADLILLVRSGDAGAFGVLYGRHAGAALVVARQYTSGTAEAEDVVADAFAAVWSALQNGSGPTDAFRAYLFTTVRRAAAVQRARGRRAEPTDDVAVLEQGSMAEPAAEEPAFAEFERSIVARAFAALPERWQAVLWHSEVEGKTPAEIAPLLGLTANSTAALAYRAREGLRQAYLQQHLSDDLPVACRTVAGKLGAYVRGGLGTRDTTQVEAHLEDCGDCRALVLELRDVNHGLRAVVAPLVLGAVGLGALHFALPTSGGLAAGSAALASGGAAAGAGASAGAGAAGATATGAGVTATGAGAGAAGAVGATVAAGAAVSGGAATGGVLATIGGLLAAAPTALVAGIAGVVVVAGVTVGAVALNGGHDEPAAAGPGDVTTSSSAPVVPAGVTSSTAPSSAPTPEATDGTLADTTGPGDVAAAAPDDGTASDTSYPAASSNPGTGSDTGSSDSVLADAGTSAGGTEGSSGSDPAPTALTTTPPADSGTPVLEVQDAGLSLTPGESGQPLALDVSNTGTGVATNLVADVGLPDGVVESAQLSGAFAVRFAVAGWDCTPTVTGARCSTLSLDAGATTTLVVRVDVRQDFAGGDVTWQVKADGLPTAVSHPSKVTVNRPAVQPTQSPSQEPTSTPTQTAEPTPDPTPTETQTPAPTPTPTTSPEPSPSPSPDPTTPPDDPTPPPTCTSGNGWWWPWWPWPCWPWY